VSGPWHSTAGGSGGCRYPDEEFAQFQLETEPEGGTSGASGETRVPGGVVDHGTLLEGHALRLPVRSDKQFFSGISTLVSAFGI
jgi:hypothetical protein